MKNILCIKTSDFLELSRDQNNEVSVNDFLDLVNKAGFWHPRDKAETDYSILQVIPYMAIVRYFNKSLNCFVYKRLKKGGEARLHESFSIGVGGHIDYNYQTVKDTSTFKDIIVESLDRELHEEVEITEKRPEGYFTRVIYDPTNDVGRVHVGLAGFVITKDNVRVKETEKLEGSFFPLKEIFDISDKFESWSKILLPDIIKINTNLPLNIRTLLPVEIFMLKNIAAVHKLPTNVDYTIVDIVDKEKEEPTLIIEDSNKNYFLLVNNQAFLTSKQDIENINKNN